MPYAVESFARDGVEFAKRFAALRAEDIPCGWYAFSIVRTDTETGRGTIKGRINVVDLRQWLTLDIDRTLLIGRSGVLSVSRADPPGYVFHGVVRGLDTQVTPTWVRLTEIFGKDNREVALSPNGEFEFRKPLSGLYCLSLLQPGHVVTAIWLDVKPSAQPQSLRIDLSEHTIKQIVVQ